MSTYIIRRLLQAVITIILVSLVIFFIIRLVPGDPIILFVSEAEINTFSEKQIEELRHEHGLDRPLMIQYVNWLKNLLRGDFGRSIFYCTSVSKLIAARLPVTIHLGISATIIATILGISAGLVSALKRGSRTDLLLTVLANLGITIPVFWLGIIMIYLFGMILDWLPIYGYTSPFEDFWLSTRRLIMPIVCMSVFSLAAFARQTRSSMLEIIRQDYIRTAWSKGLAERSIIIVHALKNALIPVVTLIGTHVAHILGGSVLIETVFNIPGIGRLLVSSVINLDYSVVQGIFLLMSIMVVFTNLAIEISYGWFDPRIRYS